MGSAQQSGIKFIKRDQANLNGQYNKQDQFGLNHIQNIYYQISDNRQQDFLKFAKDLNLGQVIDKSIFNQQTYVDNFDEIFNLDDKELSKKLQKDYDIKQSEVYIILDERTKFIQSAKRHDDKQFTIKYVNQQRQDLNKENQTILFIGEKQTGITSFANCILNYIKRIELRSEMRYQLKDSMYYNFQVDQQDYKYQMIDFPGIDNEIDLNQQLIKLHETINEFKITAVCFIAQNDDNSQQMFQKKVLKFFNKKDIDKIFIIRTFSDFAPIENKKMFKQFQSQSTSFFLESQKNPINMVNMKKTMTNIKLLQDEVSKIQENLDTNIIIQTIIINKTLKYIDEQQLLCQEIQRIIERQLRQYERQEANANQNGEIFKDFYIYKTEMEFAKKDIEQKLKQNEKIVECNQCKLSCTRVGEEILDIKHSIAYIKNNKCGVCDCHVGVHFLSDQNIIKYMRPFKKQYTDEVKKSQYDHYSQQATKSNLVVEVIKKFYKLMIQNYYAILGLEKKDALQVLSENLFTENIISQQEQLEYIKMDQIKCIIDLDQKKFINYQIEQISLYREEQEIYGTRDLQCKFEHDIQLGKFKEILLNIENYI